MIVSCSSKQSSTPEERLKWNQATLVEAYQSGENKDPRWDASAMEALADFAKIRAGSDFEMETRLSLIGDAARDAVKAGCNDALVQFLYCRYSVMPSSKPLGEKQREFRSMAQSFAASSYAPMRKFYGNIAAAEVLHFQRNTNLWPEVFQFRMAAIADLTQALEDKSMPVEEAYHAAHELFRVLDRSTRDITNAYNAIEKPLFKNWPRASSSYLIKAEFYFHYAWKGRGTAAADRVSEAQWKMFHERLALAEAALKKAWALNPKDPLVPTLMIGVVEGQGKKRPEMELWFDRAMKLDPNNYQACLKKLHYLYPQWHGSREEMVAFGRECVASPVWGGKVPLILVDAHGEIVRSLRDRDLKQDYWAIPEAWTDIRSAYEKFSRLNPDETRFRYPYAAYAVRCEQWNVFLEQIRLLRETETEFSFKYDYFGGKDDFDRVVAFAKSPAARD
jgi:hypothetical protein